jgi:hypothetical protein
MDIENGLNFKLSTAATAALDIGKFSVLVIVVLVMIKLMRA